MKSLKEGVNNFLVIVLGIFSVVLLLLIFVIIFAFMTFRSSLTPDEKEMEKVVAQGEQYIQNELNVEHASVSVMYDNEVWHKEF